MNRSVGHHDVDPAPGVARRVDEVLQFLLASDIAGHGESLASCRADFRGRSLTRVCLATRDHDPRAVLRHAARAGEAEAATGARDDRNLVAQVEKWRNHALLHG
jgi:hypothetical protein